MVALEALSAAQALDLRERLAGVGPAAGTAAARAAVREVAAFLDADRPLKAAIDEAIELVECGELVDAVESAVGSLD